MVSHCGSGCFQAHYHVDIMAAAQAVIETESKQLAFGRKVDADDIGLLVDDVIEEAGVLMREAVVILLPDVGGEQIVQRRDLAAPGQFQRHFQPFCVLAEH